MTKKPKGWRREPGRHSLAARGIKTRRPRPSRIAYTSKWMRSRGIKVGEPVYIKGDESVGIYGGEGVITSVDENKKQPELSSILVRFRDEEEWFEVSPREIITRKERAQERKADAEMFKSWVKENPEKATEVYGDKARRILKK